MSAKGGNRGGHSALDGAWDGSDVTPNDGTDLPDGICRGLLVGVSGDVKVTMAGGTTMVWPALAAGVVHPIQAKRIWATGTTATSVKAAY